MRKFSTLLLLAVFGVANAQNVMSLNGLWQFFFAKNAQQADSLAATGFQMPDYHAASFKTTPVPSNWAVLGYEEPVYRGFKDDQASEGFYIRHFSIPKGYEDKRVLLHFGGVWNSAEVWLNGQPLGRHDSGYTSFTFNVTDKLQTSDNVLAVRVRQVFPGYKTDTYDDWTLGGIYRDVTLEAMPALRFIDRMTAVTTFSNNYQDGELTVKAIVADKSKNTRPGNYPSPGKPYQLRFLLTDKDGKTVSDRTVDCKARSSSSLETTERIHVAGVHQWNAETPYLYMLRVELLEDGQVAQTCHQRIGFREISTKDGVFRINGQAVKLRGVNRHDEHPDVGRAVGRKHWLEDLQLMKQCNVNYIRACHYQHAKEFIELCDSIGMYVGAEVSLGGAGMLMYDPAFSSSVMLRTVETVERDLNNPSIVYWSVGNEDPFTAMHLRAIRVVKGLDKTRPVLMPWNADETLPEEIDILAPHYWTAHEYDSIAAQSKRPIITTEYVHAYGLQRFGGLDECFRALTSHPAGAGGAVWMWADQGIKTPIEKQESSSLDKHDPYLRLNAAGWDGITDSYRNPTQDFWETKAVYCPTLPTIDCVPLDKTVTIPIYNGYDFTDLNSVTIGWQLFVDGQQKDQGTAQLSARPHTTAQFSVSTGKLGKLKAGQTAYLWLTFTDGQGHELGRRAVEIIGSQAPLVSGKKQSVSIDPVTGLPAGWRPTIWHHLNDGDQIIHNRKGINLEKYHTKVLSIDTKDHITRSQVRYEINDSNNIDASYVITRQSDGAITIDYALTPRVQTDYVPIIGLALSTKATQSLKQWFGKGPEEAYPNKQTAPLLGLWDAGKMNGTRQMRWADVDNMRIYCDGFLDRDKATDKEVRFLSHVLGRSEKGRLNYPEYQLRSGNTFKGTVTIIRR